MDNDQAPSGSDFSGDSKPMATNPGELANKEKSDPNQTAGEEPESGAGYGNRAMPDVEPASEG